MKALKSTTLSIRMLPETLFDDTANIKQTDFDNIFWQPWTTADTVSKANASEKKLCLPTHKPTRRQSQKSAIATARFVDKFWVFVI